MFYLRVFGFSILFIFYVSTIRIISTTNKKSQSPLTKIGDKKPYFPIFALLFSSHLKIPKSTCDTLIRNINFRSCFNVFLIGIFLIWYLWHRYPYCRQNDKKLRKEKMWWQNMIWQRSGVWNPGFCRWQETEKVISVPTADLVPVKMVPAWLPGMGSIGNAGAVGCRHARSSYSGFRIP